ncbi:MAG TPA: winged helix-turn-helix domain-containing protein [Terriglobia bacterium]
MRVQFDRRFVADLDTGELFRNGRLRRLQDKPFRFLELLLSRPRQLVKYHEIAGFLWPDVKVDTRHGVKEAAQKVRQALGSRARRLQCLRGRGYRLMMDITEPCEADSVRTADALGASSVPAGFFPPTSARESVAQQRLEQQNI